MVDPGSPAFQKPPGPRLSLALIVIALGTVLGIGGLAEGVSKIVHDVIGPRSTTPTDITTQLTPGTWEIYVADDEGPPAVLGASDVTVTGPSGQHLATSLTPFGLTETLGTGGTTYLAEVQFTVVEKADYEVKVGGQPGVQILLSKSFGSIARHAAIWFVLMGVGILLGIIGVILLIVGISRRRSARHPVTPPVYAPVVGPPAPGWYPDPSVPGLSRWWDGTGWTDQTHQA